MTFVSILACQNQSSPALYKGGCFLFDNDKRDGLSRRFWTSPQAMQRLKICASDGALIGLNAESHPSGGRLGDVMAVSVDEEFIRD